MDNYILVESFGRSNVQHRLWYVMTESDLADVNAQFGDRAYILNEGQTYYKGNDDKWYTSGGSAYDPNAYT